MRSHHTLLAASLMLAAACGAAPRTTTAPTAPAPAAAAAGNGLHIQLTTLYVDDQTKAHKLYTEVLGFVVKDDYTNEGFRWLTVTAPGGGGAELQLALASDPAAKAFHQAQLAQNQPALMLYADDLAATHAKLAARGVEFTQPPTDVTYAKIATFKDGCGNLVQLTQLTR